MNKKNILFTGISGCGKDFFVDNFLKSNPGYVVVGGAQDFMQFLGIQKGDYDSFRKLDNDFKNKEYCRYMEEVFLQNINAVSAIHLVFKKIEQELELYISTVGDWINHYDEIRYIKIKPNVLFKRLSTSQLEDQQRRVPIYGSLSDYSVFLKNFNEYEKVSMDNYRKICLKYAKKEIYLDNSIDHEKNESLKEFKLR